MNKYWIMIVIIALIFTRFVGLNWGLPFALHPDEMNMAIAIMGLKCQSVFDIASCMNPHFFAYGQPPLYVGYILVFFMKFFDGNLGSMISYSEATFAIRLISAVCSLITVWYMWKIIPSLSLRAHHTDGRGNLVGIASSPKKNKFLAMTFFIIAIFTPGLIQFAHFGTTESILMACYTALTYYLLNIGKRHVLLKIGLIVGVAIATKVSALLFMIPIIIVFFCHPRRSLKATEGSRRDLDLRRGFLAMLRATGNTLAMTRRALMLFVIVVITAFTLSPHNAINWQDFMNSMGYESGVGTGNIKVFYTNQFEKTVPVVFQTLHIFPYSLGIWQFIAFIIGFLVLPYNRSFNILRLCFLIFFVPNAFLYAKWTRFVAPILPLMLIFSVFCTSLIYSRIKLKVSGFFAWIFIGVTLGFVIVQGSQFLAIYLKPDVRFEASDWINRHIPPGSFILSEERNVVNTPLENKNDYIIESFDFYSYADNQKMYYLLEELVKKADYIIVPSRRVFANYANDKYPHIKKYYEDLAGGRLGFKLIKEFRSTLLDDEMAEETFSVFDHPTVRVYERIR